MNNLLNFLTELEQNNNREWFNSNKNRFEQAKEEMLLLTETFINGIKHFDKAIAYTDAKDCLYRIYRDVRFSPDKRPYKTHLGCYIAPDGRKGILPGYYIHIQPGNSFIAGGMWNPPKDILLAIRNEIADNGEEFLSIINDDEFKNHFPVMTGEKLKTTPKGFDKAHPHIDLLRYKSFLFSKPLSDASLLNGSFLKGSLHAFEKLYKVNYLFRNIIEERRE